MVYLFSFLTLSQMQTILEVLDIGDLIIYVGTLANLVQFVGLDAKMDLEIGSPSSVPAKID